ncbi:hypothetical protein [Micromonospora sp. CPCC 206061]|uniref:hypothetical protein n=1 Tax=Micromonospora sp. CPCC 206061 TaxID=3122410 RepID=UPI002FF1DA70
MTDWAGRAAAAWAALYGTVALVWTVTGSGYPFGPGDDERGTSMLRGLPASVGAPLFAAVLLATAVAALATTGRPAVRGAVRTVFLAFGWTVVAALLLVVPDVRLLTRVGYAPMLILGAPFGWPPVDYSEVVTWPVVNMAVTVLGGLLLGRALLTWQLRTAGLCERCGRGESAPQWTSPEGAARWGRWAAYLAAAVPVLYAVSRFGWAAAVLLGLSDAHREEFGGDAVVLAGAGLGAFALGGAVLTLGLVQRWGEVFPRWMLGLAGRPVPVKLAVVPAAIVAVLVTSASLGLASAGALAKLGGDSALLVAPMALWPAWGPALGAATLAYYLRRRPACPACAPVEPSPSRAPAAGA